MLWLIGNRTLRRPILSVIIILVIKQIGLPLSSRLILLILLVGLQIELDSTQSCYHYKHIEVSESCPRRFVNFNKIVHSRKSTFKSTGFFKGSQMLYQNVEYRSNDPRTRCTCWMRKELRKLLPAKLTSVLTRKSNARPGMPQFGSNSPLHGAKLQSNARAMRGGEMDGFGIDWYISNTPQSLFPIPLYVQARYFYDVCFSVKVHLSLS